MRAAIMMLMTTALAIAAPVPRFASTDPLAMGYMGIYAADDNSAAVGRVLPNMPAAKAGLQNGDKFIRVGPVSKPRTFDDIRNWIRHQRPGTEVELTISRNSQEFKTIIVLGVHPDPQNRGIIQEVP